MSALRLPAIEYPDSDGKPMADNTLQFRWITTLVWGLAELFRHRNDVFVAGDLLWYPVEGNNKLSQAPDALVVFGRPPGDRGSYRQWEENNIPPQVVFEVLSPGNRAGEMARKFQFYKKHGVKEYYIYDPDRIDLVGYNRDADGDLVPLDEMDGFVSPLLGIRFDLKTGPEMIVYRPDGIPFVDYSGAIDRADAATARAEQERRNAIAESARADQAEEHARQSAAEAERLRQKLRAAGLEVD